MSCTSAATVRPGLQRAKASATSLRAPLPFVPEMRATIRAAAAAAPHHAHARRFSGAPPVRRSHVHPDMWAGEPEDYDAPPAFAVPDYRRRAAPARPPVAEISPLAVPDPAPRRAASVPADMACRSRSRARARARRASAASSAATTASSTLQPASERRRRRSSVTSVDSVADKAAITHAPESAPATMLGLLTSITCIAAVYLGLALVAPVAGTPIPSAEAPGAVDGHAALDEQAAYARHLPRAALLKRCLRRLRRSAVHIAPPASASASSRAVEVSVEPASPLEILPPVAQTAGWGRHIRRLFVRRKERRDGETVAAA
ncbi:hypothetical protein MIND_00270600 [Mycena indigotica]|uniref:Uncharacterized protein n=1 Tax=Mycena indigotica TaxID=2126181 RepID=A0A8H6T9A5_9AGAR|nr:uncharacterized protein MIND_00270600 [Mycena indigotica]KAF7312566.1 hypothetical protein MIND_00270600 [Mycena indigotica]